MAELELIEEFIQERCEVETSFEDGDLKVDFIERPHAEVAFRKGVNLASIWHKGCPRSTLHFRNHIDYSFDYTPADLAAIKATSVFFSVQPRIESEVVDAKGLVADIYPALEWEGKVGSVEGLNIRISSSNCCSCRVTEPVSISLPQFSVFSSPHARRIVGMFGDVIRQEAEERMEEAERLYKGAVAFS